MVRCSPDVLARHAVAQVSDLCLQRIDPPPEPQNLIGIDANLAFKRLNLMAKAIYSDEHGQLKGEQDGRHEVRRYLWPPMSSLRGEPALFERYGVELIHRFIITGRPAPVQSRRRREGWAEYLHLASGSLGHVDRAGWYEGAKSEVEGHLFPVVPRIAGDVDLEAGQDGPLLAGDELHRVDPFAASVFR